MRIVISVFGYLLLTACQQPAPQPAPDTPPAPSSRDDRAQGEMCGGIAGFGCAEDLYCEHPAGQCLSVADGAGTCVPQPEICTQQYEPVCGCDGETYGNACTAAAAGASVASQGACPA